MTESQDFFAGPVSVVPVSRPAVASNPPAGAAAWAIDDIIIGICAVVVLIASFLPWVRVTIQFTDLGFSSTGVTEPTTPASQSLAQLTNAFSHPQSATANAWNAGNTAEIGVVLALIAGFLLLIRRIAATSEHPQPAAGYLRVGPHAVIAIVGLISEVFIVDRWMSLHSKSAFGISAREVAGSGLLLAFIAITVLVGTAVIAASRRGEFS